MASSAARRYTWPRSGGAISLCAVGGWPLRERPDGKLDGHTVKGSDHHSRWLSALNRCTHKCLSHVERLDIARLAAQHFFAEPDFPEAVLLANDIRLDRHGLTFRPRRRFQSCTGGTAIDLLRRSRHRRTSMRRVGAEGGQARRYGIEPSSGYQRG